MEDDGDHQARWHVDVLIGLGAVSLVAVLLLAAQTRDLGTLLASLLATAFFTAGVLGSRARPDHAGVRALLGVGAAHLTAFALTGWVGVSAHGPRWGTWLAALVGDAFYLAGFVLLGILMATFPTGRLTSPALRAFAAASVGFALVALLVEATMRSRLGLALVTTASAVPAPSPLPILHGGPNLMGLVPVVAVAGVVLLVVRTRSLPEHERAALGWAKLAGGVLALMLVATPAAGRVLPQHVWDVAFIAIVGLVPFALLAGLVRYRLLEVDLYVVRTLGRGTVVVLVLVAYALAESVAQGGGAVFAGVTLTVVAAMSGVPLVRLAQRTADRWLTGGRVGQRAVVDAMVAAIALPDRDRLADRLCTTVAGALDVSWVRLVVGEQVVATVGKVPHGRAAEVVVPLRTPDADVGTLECGPRRGGWRRGERAEAEAVGAPAALALRDAQLTAELQTRVEQLTESRTRLVQAEQTVRRRVERDLHDGAQQQLVALLARLGVAGALVDSPRAVSAVGEAQELARQCLRDLRALVAGLHPTVLGERGLTAAVESRAGLMPIPVVVDADPRMAEARFPADVESAAFFVVSEALANVLKHSGADRARVVLAPLPDGGLRVAVADEGSGTADAGGGGLSGLRTRVEALGGRFQLNAAPGVGTTVVAEFGVASRAVAGV